MLVLVSVALVLQAGSPPPLATDQYARRFRLWDSTGRPIAVVPYRFARQSPDRQQATMVTVQLRQWSADQSESRDTSWTEDVRQPFGSNATAISGFVVSARTEALANWSWSVRMAQIGGRTMIRMDDHQTPRDDGQITLSDLVLGESTNSIEWRHGSDTTLLALSNQFDRRAAIHVFYQVRSTMVRDSAVITLTFTNVTDPHHGKFVLRFASTARLVAGVSNRTEVVDLSRVQAGKYRLELQVGDPANGGASVRPAEFELR
jgi:hypothetical protein